MNDTVKARKISVSLPSALVDDLDIIAYSLNISRSAFLSACLAPTIPTLKANLCRMGQGLLDGGDEVDLVKRYRSESKAQVDELVSALSVVLEAEQGDLFDDK